jgi:hypothetical protein
MPIPRYYRLSVSTGTNCPHDRDAREGASRDVDKSRAELLLEVEELKLKLAHFDAAKLQQEGLLQQPAGSALSSNKRSRGAATLPRAARICPSCAFEFPDEVDSGEAVGAVKVCCAWWCGSCWSAEMCRVMPQNLAPVGTKFDSKNAYKCEECGNLIASFEAHTLHSGPSPSRRIIQLPDRRLFMFGKKIRNWLHNCVENKEAQASLAVQVWTFQDNEPLVYQSIFDNSVNPLRYFNDTRASQAFHVIMAFIGVRVFGFGNHHELAANSVGNSCRSLREYRRRSCTSASEDGGPVSGLGCLLSSLVFGTRNPVTQSSNPYHQRAANAVQCAADVLTKAVVTQWVGLTQTLLVWVVRLKDGGHRERVLKALCLSSASNRIESSWKRQFTIETEADLRGHPPAGWSFWFGGDNIGWKLPMALDHGGGYQAWYVALLHYISRDELRNLAGSTKNLLRPEFHKRPEIPATSAFFNCSQQDADYMMRRRIYTHEQAILLTANMLRQGGIKRASKNPNPILLPARWPVPYRFLALLYRRPLEYIYSVSSNFFSP